MIGLRVRQVRERRDKSLRMIADLAGMSTTTLWRIEHGEHSPTLKEVLALANALQISAAELTRLPVPAPANGHTDSTIEATGLALDSIDVDCPDGLVLPVAMLRNQVAQLHEHTRACRFVEVAAALPRLIRDLHTTLSAGSDHRELLGLAVHLHVHVTRMWLNQAGAPTDLRLRVVFLARRLAQEHGAVTMLGVAAFGVVDVLAGGRGAFRLALAELDSVTAPPTTPDTVGMISALVVTRALLAVVAGRPDDAAAPMDAAAAMADRFGELGAADPLGFGWGPTGVGFRRVRLALETDDPDRAVRIAEDLHPERDVFPVNQVYHWVGYGRALAQLRGRQDDAVRALRRAEAIHPHRVQRDPFVREALVYLLPRTRRDSPAGRELRRMVYRAELDV